MDKSDATIIIGLQEGIISNTIKILEISKHLILIGTTQNAKEKEAALKQTEADLKLLQEGLEKAKEDFKNFKGE